MQVYPAAEILVATQNFDPRKKLGEGAFGTVYRGLLRHTPVAVKQLKSSSLLALDSIKKELALLSTVLHPNLILALGSCQEPACLIYELVEGGNLQTKLE